MSHLNHGNQLSDAELCVFYGNGHCNQLSDAELCVFYGNDHDAELCVFYGNGHAADGASISMSVQLLQGCKVSDVRYMMYQSASFLIMVVGI